MKQVCSLPQRIDVTVDNLVFSVHSETERLSINQAIVKTYLSYNGSPIASCTMRGEGFNVRDRKLSIIYNAPQGDREVTDFEDVYDLCYLSLAEVNRRVGIYLAVTYPFKIFLMGLHPSDMLQTDNGEIRE